MAARKIRNAWWVDFRHAGIRHRKRSPQNSKGAATAYEATLRQAIAQGLRVQQPTDDKETFGEFSARWFETYVRANNKSSEQRSKRIILRRHLEPWFGEIVLARIKPSEIEMYKSFKLSQGLSSKTINNHLAVLGKCLRTAVEWEVIMVMPKMKTLRTPPPPFDVLTPNEARRLLSDATRPMWRDMVRVALRTGMRRGELCALDWSDIDVASGLITVRRRVYRGEVDSPKNNRIHYIPMTDDLRVLFASAPGRRGYIFPRTTGLPVAESTMTRELAHMCQRVGIRPIGWHVLRHTFASRLVSEGVPLPAVKELLGHASITMTMRYTHLAPSALKSAVDVLVRAEARENSEAFGQ
jgi:integrase